MFLMSCFILSTNVVIGSGHFSQGNLRGESAKAPVPGCGTLADSPISYLIFSKLNQSSFGVLPGTDHLKAMTRTELLARMVREFLDTP